jgi:hypothetical protein
MIDDRVHMNKEVVASLLEEEDDWELVEGSTEREDTDDRVQQIQQHREGAKDRLWPLSALREVHSRRLDVLKQAQKFPAQLLRVFSVCTACTIHIISFGDFLLHVQSCSLPYSCVFIIGFSHFCITLS